MRLKWFPSGIYEIYTQNLYDATKMHKKNRRPYVCMRFSVYTEIKGSLRRWNCVCIEAFGFFNQRLLCCHGNACWTKVLWIFQQPPFLSNHLGSFHNPHNIQKFSWRGGRPVPSKLVKVSSQVSGTPSQYRFVASDGMNPMSEIKAQKKKQKNNSCKKIQSLHKCKEVKEAPCMLKRYLSTAGETEANTATTFSSFFLSVSFSRPWALGNDESVNKCALLYLVSLLTWKMKCCWTTKNIQTPLFSLFFSLHFNNLPKN